MGRGASPSANPCSFVRKHHVCRAGWAFGGWDVVLHHPQTLVPSSGSTTFIGPDGPPAAGTWCFTARKPLFLRPETPRLSDRMGLRRRRRGASPPASPYSFVRRPHVCRAGWASGGGGVVILRPQARLPSSGGTTSFSSMGAGRDGAWYLTTRKPLFLRPETPRLAVRMGLRRRRRGASPPASPYSFVRRHHVFQL